MQGEYYTEGGMGRKGLQLFDTQGYLDGKPEYIVFNGKTGALMDNMNAKVGDTIRMYVGNGGVNLSSKADALASTANFLKGHGWVRGAGYQPGQPNFVAIQGWNAAGVYQQAIAIIGKRIDG